MKATRHIFKLLFKVLENWSICCMALMVLVVFVEVIKRYIFRQGFPWSQEIATLMIVWFGFIGIAIGVLERIHMNIELFTRRFSPRMIRAIEGAGYVLIFAFGAAMVYYGLQIMQVSGRSTLPATKWPSAVVYIVLPVSGFLVAVNALLCLLGADAALVRLVGGAGEPSGEASGEPSGASFDRPSGGGSRNPVRRQSRAEERSRH